MPVNTGNNFSLKILLFKLFYFGISVMTMLSTTFAFDY